MAEIATKRGADVRYDGLKIPGAVEIGKRMGSFVTQSRDDRSWNIATPEGVTMFDEESMNYYNWEGGNHWDLITHLVKGVNLASGNRHNIFVYSQSITFAMVAVRANSQYDKMTDEELVGLLDGKHIRYDFSILPEGQRIYLDVNGSYAKVPFLSGVELYEKNNGEFVLENGKRKYRAEDGNLEIFGAIVPYYKGPHEWIKWNGTKPNGQNFYGWQSEWGEYDHHDMTWGLPEGWKWGLTARAYRPAWQPETKYFVDTIYGKMDSIMMDLLLAAKAEKGLYDITKPNKKILLYCEQRPKTEPWTVNGNSIDAREVGDGQIFFETFASLYSGLTAISSWDDGLDYNTLPNEGSVLYPLVGAENENWTRYHSKLASVQTALAGLEGTKPDDWTYIHFYFPFIGSRYSEVISSGIYYKGRLHVFFLNPSLEVGEEQSIQLKAGSTVYDLKLVGHEFYRGVFEVGDGLSPDDFSLQYTTIHGKKTKVTGRVTNDRSAHYLE